MCLTTEITKSTFELVTFRQILFALIFRKSYKTPFLTALFKGTNAVNPLMVSALDTVNPTYDMIDAFGTVAPIPQALILRPVEQNILTPLERRIKASTGYGDPTELP